ncbi:MAG: tryptophan 7-halogenase [Flavobacteriales bacterium]
MQSRIVVDCSGQDGWLSSTNGNRQFDRSLMNVAVFTYFTGVDRLSGRDAGAIFCEAIDKGWFWNIPLHDGSNSIGLVVSQPQYNAAHDPKSLFAEAIQRSVHIRRYIANSKRIEDHRVIRDYSYHSNRLHGEGFLIAGDAGNFIDPIWSTGIFLATTSAKFASEALLKWLANGSISELESYSTKVRNLVGVYEDFVKYSIQACTR